MKSNFTCIKKMPVYLLSASFCLGMFSCQDDVRTDGYSTKDVPELHALSAEQKEVIDYTPKNIVIAHRGTEFWALEPMLSRNIIKLQITDNHILSKAQSKSKSF